MCATEDFFTPERRQAEFDDALRRAILSGEPHAVICPTNLDEDTVWAINALAAEFPNTRYESVAAAFQEFAWQCDGTHQRIRGFEASKQISAVCAKYGWT